MRVRVVASANKKAGVSDNAGGRQLHKLGDELSTSAAFGL
jgi:hypothetical protein